MGSLLEQCARLGQLHLGCQFHDQACQSQISQCRHQPNWIWGSTPLNITSDFYNLVSPITRSGLTIDNFKRKDFRYSFLPPLQDLPNDYPRATPGAWHRFWNSAHIPHRATTVLWRLLHHRISSRARLHRLIPTSLGSHLYLVENTTASNSDTRITGSTIIVCGVLAIWKAHWQFIYNDERFQAQAVAGKAATSILQIEQEHNL
ncbi:hypothetical protein O0I10_009811 [Lichtheimia ornata]|uniref:Reverse transcriptase zinc-binding domain-containing protein n=1 Tax=Lichtheimia ornata TaxID=688661 RepID=A0AAD7UWE0_9FUNG|nr:uncharacterized protein O0I10_009811 [Lichtheimia ornata]KAJ8654505.1 hypothetical protein O0I10_009811 [Lichtheimia ornata]